MIPPLTPAKTTTLQRAPLKFQPGRQPASPYFAPMNWITIGIALGFAFWLSL